MKWKQGWAVVSAVVITVTLVINSGVNASDYVVVDTGQIKCYDNTYEITFPQSGDFFNGQDAQHVGTLFAFQVNGDGTVTDLNTGLTWAQNPGPERLSWAEAFTDVENLMIGGYNDWRLPTIKELYSIVDYSVGWPYIDTNYFTCELDPGQPGATQYWSSTEYVGLAETGLIAAFAVNFATGHIKCFEQVMRNYVRPVRGDAYGENNFVDNGDGTVTDLATGLMWQQADDGVTRNWEDALTYAEGLTLAGHDDWRLPNAKELQTLVDYVHSSAPIDPADLGPAIDTDFFSVTELPSGTTNYDPDYGYFWTSTTVQSPDATESYYAWYVAIGAAVDDLNFSGVDQHGAGAVRFDAKTTGAPLTERIYNYTLCVRGGIGTALTADAYTISAASGGVIELVLDAGVEYAGRDYLILGSMSGTQPGYTFESGITMPLNPDLFTDLVIQMIWYSTFCLDFVGTLDGTGTQCATLYSTSALPSGLVGSSMYFAYVLQDTQQNPTVIDFASNPIVIEIEQ